MAKQEDFYDIKNYSITFNLNTRNTFFNTPYNTNSTQIIFNIINNTLVDYIVPNFNNIDPRGYNPRSTRPIKWNYNRLINNV